MDNSELLSHSLPTSRSNVGEVLTVEKLCGLLDISNRSDLHLEVLSSSYRKTTKILGAEAEVVSNGFISTKQGMVLTSERAKSLIRVKKGQHLRTRLTAKAESNRKGMLAARRDYKVARKGFAFMEAR